MFTGQGSQYPNMGKELYYRNGVFKKFIDLSAEYLKPILRLDIKELLYPSPQKTEESKKLLTNPAISQPLIFSVEYALAQQWIYWGVKPDIVLGHSIGEYAAAAVAGLFSFYDGMLLVANRGKLTEKTLPGSMIAVSIAHDMANQILKSKFPDCVVAAINTPQNVVISGNGHAINSLINYLEENDIGYQQLHVKNAFHSPLMNTIRKDVVTTAKRITSHNMNLAYMSCAKGDWILDEEIQNPDYWGNHLVNCVNFSEAIIKLICGNACSFLEVGPGTALSSLTKQNINMIAPDTSHSVFNSIPHAKDNTPSTHNILTSLGGIWLTGAEVHWNNFREGESCRKIPLPGHPLDKKSHWVYPESIKQHTEAFELKSNLDGYLYSHYWEKDYINLSKFRQSGNQIFIVFQDCVDFRDALKTRVTHRNKVVTVYKGSCFEKKSEILYSINPNKDEDYARLINNLNLNKNSVIEILHTWNITTPFLSITYHDINKYQDIGFYSLFYLFQSLAKSEIKTINLLLVGNNFHHINKGDVINPLKSTSFALCKCAPLENKKISCRTLDIDLYLGKNYSRKINYILDELFLDNKAGDYAYRDNIRYCKKYQQKRELDAGSKPINIKPKGIYIITGGTGGLGLTFAKYLSKEYKANVILIGRTKIAPKELWRKSIERENKAAKIIKQLIEIDSFGGSIDYFCADVANVTEIESCISKIKKKYNHINGLIHAAGVAGERMIISNSRSQIESVFASKIRGTLLLDSLLPAEKLDFTIYFSALTAVTGAIGQLDYCAANMFEDAYALFKSNQKGANIISINWDAWDKVGLAYKHETQNIANLLSRNCLVDSFSESSSGKYKFDVKLSPHLWFLAEHKLENIATMPASGYFELMYGMFSSLHTNLLFSDVYIKTPLMLENKTEKKIESIVEIQDNSNFRISIQTLKECRSIEHICGEITTMGKPSKTQTEYISMIVEKFRDDEFSTLYENNARSCQVNFGPRWNCLKWAKINKNADECFAYVYLADDYLKDLEQYKLHPAIFDVSFSFINRFWDKDYIPFSFKKVYVYNALPREVFSYIKLLSSTATSKNFNVHITDKNGNLLVFMDDVCFREGKNVTRE